MTLEQVKTGSIAVVVAQIGQYSIDKAPYEAAINACTTKEEVDALVEACKTGGDFLDAYFA